LKDKLCLDVVLLRIRRFFSHQLLLIPSPFFYTNTLVTIRRVVQRTKQTLLVSSTVGLSLRHTLSNKRRMQGVKVMSWIMIRVTT